ncbi:DUF4760 domain-containing protein [Cupriavidus metallidurans]|uniref:DUF4760 domain-containing protein n=1 Tax=Cupriavidus metallidurans TaxID=119219 RepID=UPI000CE03E12|nr:DUF4760 domain-containing protein [Cupriavidus metallidurans]AVA38253.1 hypothetical protein C3Z06_32120 [Cupriavidus metallidurans]
MDHAWAESVSTYASVATAVASWVLAGVTVWMVRSQIGEAKRATGLQLFTQLARDFQDPAMRSLRRAFAAELLAARTHGLHDQNLRPLADETVLEFFENLAHLTRDRVLERRIVRNYFSVAVVAYWRASKEYVMALRAFSRDTELYSDLEWLSAELSPITSMKSGVIIPQTPSSQAINDFLRAEQSLT